MAVGPHDDEVRAAIRCMGQERAGNINFLSNDPVDTHAKPMTGEVLANVGSIGFVLVEGALDNSDHFGAPRQAQDGHRVCDGSRSGPAVVPADHDPIELERRRLNVRHDDYWPAGVEYCSADNHLLYRRFLGFGLSDNGEIKASRDTAKSIASIREVDRGHYPFE
jgi:hypothetical protein